MLKMKKVTQKPNRGEAEGAIAVAAGAIESAFIVMLGSLGPFVCGYEKIISYDASPAMRL